MARTTNETNGEQSDDATIGRALRGSLLAMVAIAVLVGGLVYWFNPTQPPAETISTPYEAPELREAVSVEIPDVPFTDITEESGIDFVHINGAYGDKLLPETMGCGCAFFDYDNDGHQDLLLVNSANWPDRKATDQPAPTMALYRNDGSGHFANVTVEAGLNHSLYGMGVAVGDYDNDGWSDVFVTTVGENRLYRNEQGKFIDVTGQAGVAGAADAWGTSCGWFDYNRDGRLDLFVCNYVKWSKEIDISLARTLDGVNRAYLPPTSFEGTFPYLYRNDGDGRFTDVSEDAGIQVRNPATNRPMGKSLGLVLVDFDRDGWDDIAVANDTVQNYCFYNRGDGTFEEIGALLGIAYDISGQARGAMGIDACRFRGDGNLGLVVGNFANEMSALYVSQDDPMIFADEAIATGLGPATRLELTFGTFFFDCDLDGRPDIFSANGHLEEDISKIQASQRYQQSPQLFWNAGPKEMTEFPAVPPEKTSPDFHRPMVGRGASYADIDSDGDLDVLITNSGGQPRLLRNDQQLGHHWLRIRLRAHDGNRDALGAWIRIHFEGKTVECQVTRTRSYLSQTELPVTIGLDEATRVDRLEVTWPDGTVQQVDNVPIDQRIEISQRGEAEQ